MYTYSLCGISSSWSPTTNAVDDRNTISTIVVPSFRFNNSMVFVIRMFFARCLCRFCRRSRRRNLLANSLSILLCHSPYYLCHFTQSLLRLGYICISHSERERAMMADWTKKKQKLFTSVTVKIKQKLQQRQYGSLVASAVVSNKRVEINKTGSREKKTWRRQFPFQWFLFFFSHRRIYLGVRLLLLQMHQLFCTKVNVKLEMPFTISTSVRFRLLSARFLCIFFWVTNCFIVVRFVQH